MNKIIENYNNFYDFNEIFMFLIIFHVLMKFLIKCINKTIKSIDVIKKYESGC